MTQEIFSLFKKLKNHEPPRNLETKILRSIELKKRFKIKQKLLFSRAGLAVSLGAFFYALFVFGKTFLESDFWQLAKLAFTDTGIITGHLGEFLSSLLETFPAIYLVTILVPAFFLFLSANFYFKSENNNHIKTWI